MFGYVKIAKPELKVKDYEMYKAVYCSLCKYLGKNYGLFTRFTLSYDFTFLALLNTALTDSSPCIERKHCVFNPLKKCNFCKDDGFLEMPSAVAMIMMYYKICDNIADEKFFKKLAFLLLKPFFSASHKKATKKYPEIEKTVSDYIKKQNRLEDGKCNEIDRAADPTATAMAEIFSLCSTDEKNKKILNRMGYCMGRYIYLLDAVCDFNADLKSGSYNVFKEMNIDFESAKEKAKPQLYFCINEAIKAFELLDIKKHKEILSNIMYLGLENTFKKEFLI